MSLMEPTALLDLVQYQQEAIVSSTIIKRKEGSVTLFAFAEGQALSEHTAPFDALVQILDGQMEITVGDNLHLVFAGQGIILPATIPHALKAIADAKMLLTMIRSSE
ncbi:MAG: cupin domain-containing protein [Candidatus Marinimicrobia bacterium]|nr:cupin domain-containing protein [Candidatus Neomarinimicrobiota bacterium]